VVQQWGEQVGERVNGYPTSWCHTLSELGRIKDQLQKEQSNE